MKKIFLLFSFIIVVAACKAQAPINPAIPHYRILKADSTYASWTELKTDKPVLIIYFSPDCPHCQHLMTEMKEHMDPFKNMQIVMITFTRTEYPYLKLLKEFSRNYELPKYKNITMGTEYPTYNIQKYYQVTTTPFIAVYDRSGKMVKSFDKPPKINDLITAIKKIG